MVRKVETNLRVLTHTNWAYLLVAVLAVLAFMRWRPQGDFAAALEENPYFSDAMAACLVGGFVAYFTEDSGIVIPAMIMLYVGVGIVGLMLERLCSIGWSVRRGVGRGGDGVSAWTAWGLVAAATLVVCWLVPWLAMRMLVPSLESGPRVKNYRGVPVFPGLGIVWVFWIGGVRAVAPGRDRRGRPLHPAGADRLSHVR